MNTFEVFCLGLALWAIIEGLLILAAPRWMQRFSKRLFPRASQPLQGMEPRHFRLYGLVEIVFGLFLGSFFLFSC